MTDEEVQTRLNLFLEPKWNPPEFLTWYGLDMINPDQGTKRLLAQAAFWAGTYQAPSVLGPGPYNHWHWEIFLQRRELVPITVAAAELAMSVNDFREVAERFKNSSGFSSVGDPWANESDCIVRKAFLRDFHKGFEATRRTTFGSYPSYIEKVHAQIASQLNYTPARTNDKTDIALEEIPCRPGYSIDCITGEPVGMGRDVFLDTGKPMQLRPDSCSWLTFAKYEHILRPKVLGGCERISNEILTRLKSYHGI